MIAAIMHFTASPLSTHELFLDARNAAIILEAISGVRPGTIRVSLDLNLTVRDLPILGDGVDVDGTTIDIESLTPILEKPRKVFRLDRRDPTAGWEAVQFFDGSHCQLVPTDRSPTAEIDGIQMHCAGRYDPFEWAEKAAASVVRKGDRVIETCGGLGYMSIQAVRLGASEVISSEISEGMLHLRRLNPWSRLEAGLPIHVARGEDGFESISRLAPRSADSVIHDPPRASLAPELYSQAFYDRAFAALKPRGRMFHYTGSPYSRGRGRDFVGGVRKRLLLAGFRVRPIAEIDAFVATRPPA